MRFRAGVPLAEILAIVRPFLLPDAAPAASPLPDSLAALEPPEDGGPGSLVLLGAGVPLRVRAALRAGLVLHESGCAPPPEAGPALPVRSVHGALAALLAALEARFERPSPWGPGPGNRVAPSASVEGCLEGGVTVEAGARVEAGAFVGAGTRLGPNCVVHAHSVIGRRCTVQAGAVIGSQGFGFFPGPEGGLAAMPHAAGVEVGDDCCIGANAVVAAGVLRPTTLGRGCKVDSLVQIAHNVRIGEGAQIASLSGIAGSTVIGKRFRMGGSAGLNGHIRIGDDVSVAAFSGVTKDVPDGATVAGFPARPIDAWRRQEIALKALGRRDRGPGRGSDRDGDPGRDRGA